MIDRTSPEIVIQGMLQNQILLSDYKVKISLEEFYLNQKKSYIKLYKRTGRSAKEEQLLDMPVNWKKGKAELKDKKSSGSNTGESGDDVYLKDGWYRLKIYAEDLAGNRKEQEICFAVNRSGPKLTTDASMQKFLKQKTAQQGQKLKFRVWDVNKMQKEELQCIFDGKARNLEEGKDYQKRNRQTAEGFMEYDYELAETVFEKEGRYSLKLFLEDEAGHQLPEKEKISIKVQLRAVMQNRPYILALIGQVLFGFTLYGRNADVLYYFTYVEGNASYYTTYSMCIIIPSIIGAACFQPVFRKLNNKGRTASIFALLTGISMLCMFFFNVKETPAAFYTLAGITQFFFSGFNTAIYAIIPDCVEYGEWKTGLRNDGFQYAFVSLGNKIGMAIGTALLAALLGKYGYVANQVQNPAVLSIMRHSFTTIPGVLWIVTAIVLFFYRLNKKRYNEIVEDLKKNRVK